MQPRRHLLIRAFHYLETHPISVVPIFIVFIVALAFWVEFVARATFLSEFYQQSGRVEGHVKALQYDHFVAEKDIFEQSARRRNTNKGWLDNCTRVGTYRNYETDKTVHFAYACMKGKDRYFGLTSLDQTSLRRIEQKVIDAGWRPREARDTYRGQSIEVATARGQRINFVRDDGTHASIGVEKGLAVNLHAWCDEQKECESQVTNSSQTYPYYLVVSIYAYKGYDDE